ncbi:MAG: hypothetical protein ACJ8KC_09375, partial [Candidatus Udaeobacter sp.]
LLEMHSLEFAVHAVEGVRDCMSYLRALQVSLQIEDIFAHTFDIPMLLFGNAPHQNVQLAGVVRKVSSDLLADEGPRQVGNFKTAINRVVIGDCNVIHPTFAQLFVQLLWIGIAIGKIETAEKPFFRPCTMARVNM